MGGICNCENFSKGVTEHIHIGWMSWQRLEQHMLHGCKRPQQSEQHWNPHVFGEELPVPVSYTHLRAHETRRHL
eukprot:11764455-Prorocentrum_lima.AAC.1